MLNRNNVKQSKIKIYSLVWFIFLLSCNQELKKNPNSFEVTHYDNFSKIKRQTLCFDFRLINEKIFSNDSIIEYQLVKSDTVMEKDSLGIFENIIFTYNKKLYVNNKLIYVQVSDSIDKIDFCDCENNCK